MTRAPGPQIELIMTGKIVLDNTYLHYFPKLRVLYIIITCDMSCDSVYIETPRIQR